jgi:3-phenylpropionate/trans-cinnamate dioxygenase ferredoxin reductase subunit
MPERVVVVGGGLGGLRTVESLRRLGCTAPITLISEEELHPYDRPPLSKQLLHPDRLSAPPFLRDPGSYGELCELVLGHRAVGLDTAARAVVLDDGTEVPFGTAVLAPGTTPRRLPLLAEGAHTVRNYGDAVRLREAITRHHSVAIVGAGFMGCEIASAAAAAGASVTLVEAAPAPLHAALGAAVGSHVRDLQVAGGVDVRCGVGVTGVREDGAERHVVLSDGRTVDASVVAVCIGVEPAVEWLRESGIALENGIVCDEHGETSVPGVYAVGDAAAWYSPVRAAPVRVEHWTTTGAQALAVARTLTGDRAPLDPLHYFWSDQCGTKLQCFGLPAAGDDVELTVGPDGASLLAVYGLGDDASAVLGIGRARELLRLRSRLAAGATFGELAGAVREQAA